MTAYFLGIKQAHRRACGVEGRLENFSVYICRRIMEYYTFPFGLHLKKLAMKILDWPPQGINQLATHRDMCIHHVNT